MEQMWQKNADGYNENKNIWLKEGNQFSCS